MSTTGTPADAAAQLDRARRAWAAADWAALAAAPPPDEALPPAERRVLALLAAGGAFHAGDLLRAGEQGALALALGADPALLGAAWIAALHDDLAEARRDEGEAPRADAARAGAAALREQVGQRADPAASAAPPTRLDRVQSEVGRYRTEVLRQRALIEKLRASMHARPADADAAAADKVLIGRILGARLTYLSPAKLVSIARTCRAIEEQHIAGDFVEAGCALGGSAILIASVKRAERPLEVYDVFGMIPPPSDEDTPDVHERYRTITEGRSEGIGGDRYYGYETDLYHIVQRNLASFHIDAEAQQVKLVQGLVQDTLTGTGPVAFAHLDLDWYEPVTVCLERLWPRLSPGGSIIVDDYHDWGGCRRAVDRFLGLLGGGYVADDSAGSLKLTRTGVSSS